MLESNRDGCGPAIASILTMPFTITLRGWILSVMWGWFAVPLGLMAIGLWHACGVSSLIGLLIFVLPKEDDNGLTWDSYKYTLFMTVSVSFLTLGFGAIYHMLMG